MGDSTVEFTTPSPRDSDVLPALVSTAVRGGALLGDLGPHLRLVGAIFRAIANLGVGHALRRLEVAPDRPAPMLDAEHLHAQLLVRRHDRVLPEDAILLSAEDDLAAKDEQR